MSKEREILKSLLLKEELDRLDKLEKMILSKDQFTQEVSQVLAGAIERSKLQDNSLENALSQPINKGITKAFTNNKQSIVDSLLPIMGQLIRKTVTNSIKQFVSDINRTLELNLSVKSIKWRMQAKKAGISYAEMVFQKTISYKVQELFVINRENGILILHVGENETLVDKNAISGMLTVIQDFIADSVKTSEKGLFSATIGDASYLIAAGPKAYLATVVKGSATERLKQRSQELIENIHADFSDLLIDESRYQNDEIFDEYLRNHLISKSITDQSKETKEKKKINWVPWSVLALLVVLGIFYWLNYRSEQFQNIKQLAQSTPGFVLQSINREDGGFVVSGLLDPIADSSSLQVDTIKLRTQPFISLDKNIIQKRVLLVTKNYSNIVVKISDNNAIVSGSVPREKHDTLIQQLKNVIGIDTITDKLEMDYSQPISNLLQKFPNVQKQSSYKLESNSLVIEGEIQKQELEKFIEEFNENFTSTTINKEKLVIVDPVKDLIKYLNTVSINYPKLAENAPEEKQKLEKIITSIKSLIEKQAKFKVNIIGESDCDGRKSDEYSLNRAEIIFQKFIENTIETDYLQANIKSCDRFDYITNKDKQKVIFKVL